MSEDYGVQPLTRFIEELKRENFDACEGEIDGQKGLLLGPKGLDPVRTVRGTEALFFPNWELNDPANNQRIEHREFHDIVENRPSDWKPFRR